MNNVIYKIRNIVNGHYYIGSTVDSRKRFWSHRKDLRTGKHVCVHLQRAWNKYGEDCFKFEIVEQLDSKESLFPAEQKWLDEHFGKEYCYNVAAHADAPMRDASPELRAKLAERTKAWLEREGHPRQGYKLTDSEKEKISVARYGKTSGENHYRYGKTVSEEVRRKIGDAQRGVKKNSRTYSEDGLRRAQENMKRNAREQQPLDFGAVKAKFPQDVQDQYDFSNAEYTGALERITGCICPKHGEFSQYAAQFRKGRGCPECGAEQRAESKRQQMKQYWGTEEGRSAILNSRVKTVDKPNT